MHAELAIDSSTMIRRSAAPLPSSWALTGLSLNRHAYRRNSSCRSPIARTGAIQRAELSMQSTNDRFRPKNAPDSVEAADDVACLNAVVRGDREAFERLYRRYYERLFRFSLRVT